MSTATKSLFDRPRSLATKLLLRADDKLTLLQAPLHPLAWMFSPAQSVYSPVSRHNPVFSLDGPIASIDNTCGLKNHHIDTQLTLLTKKWSRQSCFTQQIEESVLTAAAAPTESSATTVGDCNTCFSLFPLSLVIRKQFSQRSQCLYRRSDLVGLLWLSVPQLLHCLYWEPRMDGETAGSSLLCGRVHTFLLLSSNNNLNTKIDFSLSFVCSFCQHAGCFPPGHCCTLISATFEHNEVED